MAEFVRATMLTWLLAHGYQGYQAEAMIRSAGVETTWRPCAVGRSGNFLFQWRGTRLVSLRRFARTWACPALETQLAFADIELRTDPAYRAFWSTPPRTAYATFRHVFERCRRC